MVDRTVVFYRWHSVVDRTQFLPHEVSGQVAQAIAADESRALVVGRDSTTALRVVDSGDARRPTKLQLLAVRGADNHPVEWSPGQTVRRLLLDEGHYTADVTHVCLWPDGIAAQDWHGHAPRLGRLAYFLRESNDSYVSFQTLYRPDMLTRLERLRGHLRTVDIALTTPDYAELDRDGTFGTLLPAVYGRRTPSVAVRFGMGRYGPRDRYIDSDTEDAVFEVAENAQETVDRLIIRGYDPEAQKVVQVNLLTERVGVDVAVEPNPEAPTLPDEDDIYAEILESRRTLEDEGVLMRALEAQAMRPR